MLDWEDFGIPVGPLVDDPVVSGQVGGNVKCIPQGKVFRYQVDLGWYSSSKERLLLAFKRLGSNFPMQIQETCRTKAACFSFVETAKESISRPVKVRHPESR